MAFLSTIIAMGVALAVVLGGVLVILKAMDQRSQTLDRRHRERMAMIERGLIPGPERDPAAFEAHMRERPAHNRFASFGIAVLSVGFGLMLLIGVAGGAPEAGIGVGGAVAIVGIAFIINGRLQARNHPGPPLPRPAPPERPDPTGPPGS